MDQVIGALGKSGFPFETRIAHEVIASHPWKLIETEYPWADETGGEHFIDLIAYHPPAMLLIECKKAQDRSLTFLRPLGVSPTTGIVESVTCVMLQQPVGEKSWRRSYGDVSLPPSSFRSEYCVMATDKHGRDLRLLEDDARLLVRAADAIARTHSKLWLYPKLYWIPVIVTTASLYTIRYKPPEAISLKTGTFIGLQKESIESVEWIRLQKTFTAKGDHAGPRTVFVVHSESFRDFLDRMRVML